MAAVSQLIEMVSAITTVKEKTVNYYARALLDGGLLPLSRGRAVAHIEREHVANLLIAIGLQSNLKTIVDVVSIYGKIQAVTNKGKITAHECFSDLLGAASAGGVSKERWENVKITIFIDSLGVNITLPNGELLEFRMSRNLDLPKGVPLLNVDPTPYFSRSATYTFGALDFLCQLLHAKTPEPTPQGIACVEKIEGLRTA